MRDEELVKIFDQLNKDPNNQKIHDYYQKKIKKLYQELIKYKYDRNVEKQKQTEPLNENDKAIRDLKDLGSIRPTAFVNKKIATRALIAQDKLTYYGQALADDEIDMTWIQLCTLLKVTDKKQVLRTVKGYHEKLPNYLNLKTTLVTLINTVDPLGAIVPMSARNSDECLKYTDRLVQQVTKMTEHTARTKPTMLTPTREPLPIRNMSKIFSVQSLPQKVPMKKTSLQSVRSPVRSLKSSSSSTSNKRDSKSDIHLSVSRDSTKKSQPLRRESESTHDDVSITSSMIDRIINEVPHNKSLQVNRAVSNASFGSSQVPEADQSFLDQFTRQSLQDETVNTEFLNEISRQLRKGHNGSSVSDL